MVLELYQVEWCPFSSAVRELLTERGIDFVARQVEPWPEDRDNLRAVADGHPQIPVLVTEDGQVIRGTRAIFRYVETLDSWQWAAEHRRRFHDHRPARESDVVGQLIERAALPPQAPPEDDDVQVVDNRDESRYELRSGDRMLGLAAYSERDGDRVLTHTEVDAGCEGRGYGSRLAAAALADARASGRRVVPLCPFIASYLERHPKEQDLVAPGYGR